MKTFVLTVSRVFPATHKRKGEQTYFADRILSGQTIPSNKWMKIHTIRANYELWEKRIKQVQEGKAILSIRYWLDKPYRSKQVEICQLDKDSGIGVQKIFIDGIYRYKIDDGDLQWGSDDLAKNDGLSVEDFKEWFRCYDLRPMAIIHFTKFRY